MPEKARGPVFVSARFLPGKTKSPPADPAGGERAADRGLCTPVLFLQPEADGQCLVDTQHGTVVQTPHMLFQPPLVERADLFQQHDGVFDQTAVGAVKLDVCRQLGFVLLTGDGSGNDCGTEAVADIHCAVVCAGGDRAASLRLRQAAHNGAAACGRRCPLRP